MTSRGVALAGLGSTTLGVWTRAEALAVVSAGVIRALLNSGSWQVVLPGVYADGGYVLDHRQWAMAAVLASGHREDEPRVVACGRTAARVWKLPLIDDDDPATGGRDRFEHDVHVAAGLGDLWGSVREGDPRAHVVRRHRLRLDPDDVVHLQGGVWITSQLRTLVTCAHLLSPEALVCQIDDGLHRDLFTVEDLTRLCHQRRGVPGTIALAEAIARADGRAEGPIETLGRLLLQPVLPGLEPQVRLYAENGTTVLARFDLADPAARFAVDLDGKAAHAGELMVARDRRRDWLTAGRDWWTERGTWYDVRRRQEEFVARVTGRYDQHVRRAA